MVEHRFQRIKVAAIWKSGSFKRFAPLCDNMAGRCYIPDHVSVNGSGYIHTVGIAGYIVMKLYTECLDCNAS